MLESQPCAKHPGEPITNICISKGCEDRSLCSSCYASHNGLHYFIPWSFKVDLKEVRAAYLKRKQQRLAHIISSLKDSLTRSLDTFQQSMSRQIKLVSEDIFLEHSEQNQMLANLVRQVVAGNYSELDPQRHAQLQVVMQRIYEANQSVQVVEMSPMDEALIGELVSAIEERLKVIDKILWMKPPTKPKSQIRGAIQKQKAVGLLVERPVEQAHKKFIELAAETQAQDARLSKLLDQRKNRNEIVLNKAGLGNTAMLAKVLNRVYDSYEVNLLAINNSDVSDLKAFELLEGSLIAQNLRSIDLSSNQICSAMELCFIGLPSIEKIRLGRNRIYDLQCFQWHPWPTLKLLDLSSNSFRSLSPVQRFRMPACQDLIFDSNQVDTLIPIGKSNFPSMSKLSLNDVKVADKSKISSIPFDNEKLRLRTFMTL